MSLSAVRRLVAFFFVLFLFLFLFTIANAEAQTSPPQKSDAEEASIFERIFNRARFENDGTGVEETEAVIRIQSRAGVEQFGQLVFGYSSATEQLKVEYVRVRKPDGQVVTTPDSTAQDFAPDVLKEAPMYSDYRQRHISVAALQPGDTVEYRTVTRIVTPLAAGHFWYEHTFPKGVVVNEDRLEIDVPKSREVKLKSPERKPEIQEKDDRRIYTWVVKDIKPKRDRDADDDEEDIGPDVQITTFSDWKQLARWYAKLQGERMVVDDGVRKKADELVKGATTNDEKSRRLYDYVARDIRYVSLSFGIGRYQPHAPSDVMTNGYGDCKDKHTLLSAMLRAEGIQSYPVLIHSSRKLDPDVPSPGQFDHVITAERLGPGASLTWLDTTTEVAPYGLILFQLRNKDAVLASEDSEGGLKRTPADSPVRSSARMTIDGKVSEFGALDATLEYAGEGDRDFPMRSSFRQVPQSNWKDFVGILSRGWGFPGDVDQIQVDPIENTSKPFRLKYHVRVDQYFTVPSTSANFRPVPPLGVRAAPSSTKSKEPFEIGPAGSMDYRVRLEFPTNYSVSTPTAVRMARDYGEYSSSYSLTKGVLEGERKLTVKLNELPASRRADYDSFRNVTRSDESQVLTANILAPSGKNADHSAAKIEGTPSELQRAGRKALQSKDYRSAIDLLKRAVDGDGNLKEGWYDLGQAYAGANNHAEAIRAFQKQVELDPNHKSANGDLAMEFQQSGRSDEAIAAYRKQLEIVPFEKSAHKNLGMLLSQMGRDSDARTELETAVSIPPDDPETKLSLAQVYTRLGEKAKAQELLKGLTGSSASDSGTDIFAASLTPDIDPVKTENDARQVLYDIGEQFDSGDYDRLGPAAFSSMRLVALSWSRIGWSKFLRGESLEGMQFLNSAWLLSQSGTVANRLGQLFEKQGQRERASQMYAFAIAAGGGAFEDSRERLSKLATVPNSKSGSADLVQARTVKLGSIASKGSAHFNLVFDGSPRPERAEFVDGDESLRSVSAQLREKDFPVKFPDASSVKIVRHAELTCGAAGCVIVLLPIEESGGGKASAAAQQ